MGIVIKCQSSVYYKKSKLFNTFKYIIFNAFIIFIKNTGKSSIPIYQYVIDNYADHYDKIEVDTNLLQEYHNITIQFYDYFLKNNLIGIFHLLKSKDNNCIFSHSQSSEILKSIELLSEYIDSLPFCFDKKNNDFFINLFTNSNKFKKNIYFF
jgi:hypothetical protein